MDGKLRSLTVTGLFTLACGVLAPATAVAEEIDDPAEQLQESRDTLEESANLVVEMAQDEDIVEALRDARGVFLVPNYARLALGVGGSGGEGVLIVQGNRSQPLFYNFGAISAGAQIGIEAGQIAMILMTDDAVDSFMQEHNFSLNADAGLTIIDFSARAQGSLGKGDIMLWSDTEGAFADLAVNIEDIVWDDEENQVYYGQDVSPEEVARGGVTSEQPNPLSNALQ